MDERLDYGMDEWVNLFLLHKEEREENLHNIVESR